MKIKKTLTVFNLIMYSNMYNLTDKRQRKVNAVNILGI